MYNLLITEKHKRKDQSNCNQTDNCAELYKDCVHTLNMNKIVEQTKHRTHT